MQVSVAEIGDHTQNEEIWQRLMDVYPTYNKYVAKTDRRIPLVERKPFSR